MCLEETKLSLNMEVRQLGTAAVLGCTGRIVFRDEVVALSELAGELIEKSQQLIIDFQGITAIDSAGLGELVGLHMWGQANGCPVKVCGLSTRMRYLLEITNLTSILDIYTTAESAVAESETEVA